jgi:hypothetical protein
MPTPTSIQQLAQRGHRNAAHLSQQRNQYSITTTLALLVKNKKKAP